jgi:heterodisulfide reductase subunit C
MAGKITFAFRGQLDGTIGGDHHNYCLQCGACVASCPAARYSSDFNPRTILLRTLLGQEEELIAADSVIWLCTNCYTCYERCPQDVRPIEVIIALKNMAAERGELPDEVNKFAELISSKGHSAVLSESVNRRREKLGLDPIPRVPVEELAAILADPEEEEVASGGTEGGEVAEPAASRPADKDHSTKERPARRAGAERAPVKKASARKAPPKKASPEKQRTRKRSKR